jgi:hypothetical protein
LIFILRGGVGVGVGVGAGFRAAMGALCLLSGSLFFSFKGHIAFGFALIWSNQKNGLPTTTTTTTTIARRQHRHRCF